MEHWRVPYLGLSEVPSGLDDYELTTFFTFSTSERLARVTLNVTMENLPGQQLYEAQGWSKDAQFFMYHRYP